jgi:hypothetical protein
VAERDHIHALLVARAAVREADRSFAEAVQAALRSASPAALIDLGDVSVAVEVAVGTADSGNSWRAEPGMVGRPDDGVSLHLDHDPGDQSERGPGPTSRLVHVPLAALDSAPGDLDEVRRRTTQVLDAHAALRASVRTAIADLEPWVSTGPDAAGVVAGDDPGNGLVWRVEPTDLPLADGSELGPGVIVYVDDADSGNLVGLSIFRIPTT